MRKQDLIATPQVLWEDNHLLVLRKPYGMPAQADPTEDPDLLSWAQQYIRRQTQKQGNIYATLIHRLDRPVAGILVVAKTSKAAARLNEQMQHKTIEKSYAAIVERRPDDMEGVLTHYLSKLPGKNIVRAHARPKFKDSREARLYYHLQKTVGRRALLEVYPLTGRQHQIRVQLAKAGLGIAGDKKYANTSWLPGQAIALFAQEIAFQHPTRAETIRLRAPLPDWRPWRDFTQAAV
jgi:23S rRNA pseudouridine1911/1915/1917 synthase